LSIEVNLFHPKINTAIPLDSGSIVVKVGDAEEGGKGEVSLFFMQNSDLAVRVLNVTPDSPIEQVTNFITGLLHSVGFTYYEYERSLVDNKPDVTALHPNGPDCIVPLNRNDDDGDIVWVVPQRFVTIHQ